MRSFASLLVVALATGSIGVDSRVLAQTGPDATALYEDALARESLNRRELNAEGSSGRSASLRPHIHETVAAFEELARQYPRSPHSDDALWHGAVLSADAFWQFGDGDDKAAALRLFARLASEYPASPFVKQVASHTNRLKPARPTPRVDVQEADRAPVRLPVADTRSARPAVLRAIKRDVLPDALRITLELEREAVFNDQRLTAPSRLLIDFPNSEAADGLKDSAYPDDVVRQIRVARQPGARTRVVMDLQGAARYSVYSLYDPFRVVIDIERDPTAPAGKQTPADVASTAPKDAKADLPAAGARPEPAAMPAPKATGSVTLSRQLGLGISRIVIDPGHGGHDPGAMVKGLNEADVVLDVALRLEKLLQKQPGVDVVLTRRNNLFVPLEERTAIANRRGADLFLSIHANASTNVNARGIESYFLNFAPNSEAEAIAARENAGSAKTMRNLPDIVKAIAMNDKIDESRDFASNVQDALFLGLHDVNPDVKSLGVKQAPFMVLIGATMPSVLTEISFVTNTQEAMLLSDPDYRQQIAEALLSGITQYQRSLKLPQKIAAQN